MENDTGNRKKRPRPPQEKLYKTASRSKKMSCSGCTSSKKKTARKGAAKRK